ncbi:MAG: amino acid adenylation domain-containing protein [Planctomycetota bacterium]
MSRISTEDFLLELRRGDIRISLEGEHLRLSAPKGVLSPALQEELRARKSEILAYLRKHRDASSSSAPPLVPTLQGESAPLSFAQERLWFLYQMDPQSSAYNLQQTKLLKYRPDVVQKALTELAARQQILRTTYATRDAELVQVVHPASVVPLPVVDLSGLPGDQLKDVIVSQARDEAKRPFDLTSGPVWRALALSLADGSLALILTMHHIASDGWSLATISRELDALCEAHEHGQTAQLPDLPLQYRDYAVWQRRWLQDEILRQELAYWRETLAGSPPTLDLPADLPRPAIQTYAGAAHLLRLSPPLSAALKGLSKSEEASLFMTMLAVFKTLLWRYTGQTDIVVGTPIAGRSRREVQNLIGLFLNELVLRTDLSGDPTFRQLLHRVRDTTLGAYAHQDLPFEKIVEALQPQRDLSRSPIFQVFFNMLIVPAQDEDVRRLASGLWADSGSVAETHSQFDLSLSVRDEGERITLVFVYNTDLFTAPTIERMAGHLRSVAEAVAADPDQRLSQLPLLTDAERTQLLVEWNRTQHEWPDQPVHELFAQQVTRTPDACAVDFEGKGLTYRDLEIRANRLAHHLRKLGVGPETKVGLFVERSLDLVVGVLGILKAGGAYFPLDPAYPRDRLAFMLGDSRASVLVTQEALPAELPAAETKVVCLDRDQSQIEQESDASPRVPYDAGNLAYMIYTSGSTGKPKGVEISHGALLNFLNAMREEPGLTASDVLLAVTTLSFDIAALEIFLPLTVGARVVVASRPVASDGMALARLLDASGATVMQATPATWRMLIASGWRGDPRLKILCGGDALPRDLAAKLLERGGCVWNLYGPTETTVWSTVHRVTAREGPVAIGRPIANTEIYILDACLQPLPAGVPGELHIGGAGVARGYWNRPELTAERFIRHPFSADPRARLYRTGDRARYLEGGEIEHLGRLDQQVKLRGFRIELGEIEASLRLRADVKEAVAIVREDVPGDQRLVAYIVPAGAAPPSTSDLRGSLRGFLPEYMVPSAFVFLDALPLTPSGKVDRRALPAPQAAKRDELGFVPPRTSAERALAQIWCEVLGVERAGVYDNFFDLGGHSLLTLKVIAKFEESTGFHLNPVDFFQQTLGQLAASYEQRGGTPRPASEVDRRDDLMEPCFLDTSQRALFGCYRRPLTPRDHGAVICYPHAHEYIRSHRACRELALRLARSGFHVLSFDYFGCGDSEGSYEEARVAHWMEDTAAAIEAMKRRFRLDEVSLVGLRLGASLAMMTAAARDDINALVLWNPVLEGRTLVEEMIASSGSGIERLEYRERGIKDVHGYPLTPEMVADLGQIDLTRQRFTAAPRLLVVETGRKQGSDRLRRFYHGLDGTADYERVLEHEIWLTEPYEALVPQKTLETVVSWISRVCR